MTAERLHSMLVDAGVNVRQVSGWETRGYEWARGKPVGQMVHHTSLPVPYPVDRLYGSLLKCNWNTKPNGELWLVAFGACNYSSGSGSSVVLNEVLAGTPPEANARERGLDDDYNANPWFFNGEHDHEGHGEPMPAVQSRTIKVGLEVFNAYFGHSAGNVISHAESTARKTDPYWDGDRRVIETIRNSLEDDMTPEQEAKLDQAIALLGDIPRGVWGYFLSDPDGVQNPDDPNDTRLGLHTNTILRYIRRDTRYTRAKVIGLSAAAGAGAAEIVDLIASRLAG